MKILYTILGLLCFNNVTGQDFKPDTTINKINLENSRSITDKFKSDTLKVRKRFGETRDASLPFVDFLNKTEDQTLTLIFHPGNWINAFSEFKIQYSDAYKEKEKAIRIVDKEFVTEKGIKLGAHKSDLIKNIGKPTTIKRDKEIEIIEYRTSDPNSKILKKYRQAEYFAIYKLKDDKIVEFHFGFIYP
jgi:hypothetical protein